MRQLLLWALSISALGLFSAGGVQAQQSLVILVTGGSASGKTTFVEEIVKLVNSPKVGMVSQDSFLRPSTTLPKEHYIEGRPNFDHPTVQDFELGFYNLELLAHHKKAAVPKFVFAEDRRVEQPEIGPFEVVIVEGNFALYDPRIRALSSLNVFVDLDVETRFQRRLARDAKVRGQTPAQVEFDFFKIVQPMHEIYILPMIKYADRVVSGANYRGEAVLIANRIKAYLVDQGNEISELTCNHQFRVQSL